MDYKFRLSKSYPEEKVKKTIVGTIHVSEGTSISNEILFAMEQAVNKDYSLRLHIGEEVPRKKKKKG